jgi:hypothetical protein
MAISTAAALIGSAVIGGTSSAISGSKAAKAQKNAAAQQAANERYFYDTTRADQAPWRETGAGALGKLAKLYGVGGGESGGPATYDLSEFFESPQYRFSLEEGNKAIQRASAARGLYRSGGSAKAETRFAQGLAAGEFQNYANTLAGMAGVGQTATQATSQAGAQAAAGISQAYRDAGNARASSYANTGSAINSGINNVLSAYLFQQGRGGK